jgi:putative ABC transport system permease protein
LEGDCFVFNLTIIQSALELGAIYSLVALALFVSFSTLNIADLTTDGSFTLGCAVSASFCIAGHPVLALPAALLAGAAAGFVTAFLQTKLGVPSILAGIVTNTGLYTINLAVMGFSANLNLFRAERIFDKAQELLAGTILEGWDKFLTSALIAVIVCGLLIFFLNTRLGLSVRATGDNPDMVSASSINPAFTIAVGLCIANAMTALSGAVLVQYQKSADINLGTGMVTIALASLIIGETLFGKGGMLRCVAAVFFGSVIYRFIVALALQANINAAALKLISAVIVGLAIAMPALKEYALLQRQKSAYRRKKKGGAVRAQD